MAADIVGKQNIRTEATTDAQFALYNSAGTNAAAVDGSGNVSISIGAQTLAAVAVSKTTAANAANNSLFVEPTQASAVLSATNALAMRLTDGAAFNAQANPVFAAVSKNTSANAAGNPIFMELSDGSAQVGTSGNPLFVSFAASTETPPGTELFKYDKTSSIAAAGTANFDYTVTAGKTLTVYRMYFTSPEAGHFDVIYDPSGTNVNYVTVYVSPSNNIAVVEFDDIHPTFAATKVLRVTKTNDSHAAAPFVVMWQGVEN
jgi:hypothetical protein